MKIAVCSDLHLEFGPYEIKNTENADVLILGGDTCVVQHLFLNPKHKEWVPGQTQKAGAKAAKNVHEFFAKINDEFPYTIMILGNHEYYDGVWENTYEYLGNELGDYPNIYLLEKETMTIDDVTFVGTTLWTDCNKFDDLTMWHLKQNMNDYFVVKVAAKNNTRLTPQYTAEEFIKNFDFIKNVVYNDPNKKYVVCTHHLPAFMSVNEQYKNDRLMNGGYVSDCSEFIMDHPQIKLWTHGHTHQPCDYIMGNTRVVCNPRGYVGYEPQAFDYKPLIVEI